MPLAVQTQGGPFAGQSFNRPVSFEMLVRSGPCQPGQSAARIATTLRTTVATTARACFIGISPGAEPNPGTGSEAHARRQPERPRPSALADEARRSELRRVGERH